ncbi:MAG TPA: hypothetical protein VGP26_15930 [Actinophytocola sp.]|jgi:hypothetical protein|nr:hypothetical protein [Actinophytocola sp.]
MTHPASTSQRWLLTAWRLLVAASALVGFGYAVTTFVEPWHALSQQASLLTGVVYLGLAVFAGRSEEVATWLRGGMAVLLVLVCVTYLTLISGDLHTTASLFEHLVTPLVVLADWAVVGRTVGLRWWFPLSWVVFPLAYLIYFVLADVQLYRNFLDPTSASFGLTVLEFMLALVVAGYVLYGAARLRSSAAVRLALTPEEAA